MAKTVKKVKLLPDNGGAHIEYDVTVDVTYELEGKKKKETLTGEGSKTCKWQPHADMQKLFDQLKPYLAHMCDQIEYIDEEFYVSTLKNFKVTGFTIGGEGEHEGVTLIGQRILAHNRVLNIVAPFMKWEDENTGYEYAYEVAGIISNLKAEALLYMDGKRTPSAQGSLFEEEQPAPQKQLPAAKKLLTETIDNHD